ncbi:hypothetical protein [Paenibacillus caui]|uniref:hypothetical protein n=1 Tax=Paenibacillus caui TaxID=2873927 RepID=UPI001CA8B5E4|nr:hypothetical protein [Paenibacillus caui]
MKFNGKIVASFAILLCVFFAISVMSYAASTVIVYNGNASSGWYGSGTFNTSTACGYDGSMYYQNAASGSNAIGGWNVKPTSTGNDDYYVYITSCHAYAQALYSAWDGDGNRVDLNVNQNNYSNIFYYLGNYYVAPNGPNGIQVSTYSSTGELGFDEAKFYN